MAHWHDNALRKAKTRPDWCSPARWRIELRRRADRRRYERAADITAESPSAHFSRSHRDPGEWSAR